VIEPFNCSYEINSGNFFSVSKENAEKENIRINKYLINEKIFFNFILKNNLSENINIKNIEIELDKDKIKGKNENIKINSNLLEVMDIPEINEEIKKDILTILSKGEYCIPFDTQFFEEFKGKIGKIKIKWVTPSLNEYEQDIENSDNNNISLINENCFDFPFIIVNKLELDYKYEINMNEKKEILLNIKVENHTKKNKKIIFFIENGNEINCMISGKVKQSKNIRAEESINFVYKLIPLQYGELKLPSLKIWEMSLNINSKDKKICSHYYFLLYLFHINLKMVFSILFLFYQFFL
jgi:translation initiation factor IF-1